MKYIYSLLIMTLSLVIHAQDDFNIELVAQVEYPEGGNDVWGFVAEDGTEYAIIGTITNTRIYNLSDPSTPREIITIPGAHLAADSTSVAPWRDMKSWDDHVYVSTDGQNDGLLVIDMSEAATDSVRFQYLNPQYPVSTGDQEILGACHNIFIDELGFAYLAGCSGVANKAVIFDLNQDKWNPPVIAAHGNGTQDSYSHDIFARDNIMYSSEIFAGEMRIFDVSNKQEISLLGNTATSFNFTHNIWISDDGNYAFTTDERGNAYVDSYDISDFSNIRRLDSFQPSETAGNGVVPHNTHYIDDYLVTSWYTDGIVITDVSRPENMVKVGSYDTHPGRDGGTNGCWGAYPWLPSGLILANDRGTGFFVLRPEYVRAAFLEGTITDAADGSPINNVEVEVLGGNIANDLSQANGLYQFGLSDGGTYTLRLSNNQYITLETEVELINGELVIHDIQMQKRPVVVSGRLVSEGTGEGIANAAVRVMTEEDDYEIETDFDGNFSYCANAEEQNLILGAWGYLQEQRTFVASAEPMDVEMRRGYEDDFVVDQGWIVDGDTEVGVWVREVPIETIGAGEVANIGQDVDGDLGEEAYITGNAGQQAGTDDVDDVNILRSPPMQLSDLEQPVIEFQAYFFNCCFFNPMSPFTNGPENDSLMISISDGTNLVSFMTIHESTGTWTEPIQVDVNELGLDTDSQIIIAFTAKDTDETGNNGHWVEAGLDAFRVFDAGFSSTTDTELVDIQRIKIFPNPTANYINVETEIEDIAQVKIYSKDGKLIRKSVYEQNIDVSDLGSDSYMLMFVRKNGEILTSQFVKNK